MGGGGRKKEKGGGDSKGLAAVRTRKSNPVWRWRPQVLGSRRTRVENGATSDQNAGETFPPHGGPGKKLRSGGLRESRIHIDAAQLTRLPQKNAPPSSL